MSTVSDILAECKTNPRVAALRGRYRGRVWLIGNGGSLRDTPLELLTKEYSFAMNGIAMLYPHTAWRPSFYFCASSNARFEARRPLFTESINLGIPSFLLSGYRRWGWLEDRENIYWVNIPKMYKDDYAESDVGLWSNDAARWLARSGTSMYCVMQLAAHLGFDEFYLLGCDLGWKRWEDGKTDPNHFSEGYSFATKPVDQGDADRMNGAMYLAHRRARAVLGALGIKVFNATRGGELDVYPRVRMEDVLR